VINLISHSVLTCSKVEIGKCLRYVRMSSFYSRGSSKSKAFKLNASTSVVGITVIYSCHRIVL